GRRPVAASAFKAKPGQRSRIRCINSAADPAFRSALAGHSDTVAPTAGDPGMAPGFDALLCGTAALYAAMVTATGGV
ncbi:multicopper oxidase family protein, partial [Mycobacterium tuberculosis]|nr:multicopper oxidase family protein [Mycobacterium tuberculosis]